MSTVQTSPAVLTQGTGAVDPAHSSVGFAIKHLGITAVTGCFRDFDGTLEVVADGTVAVSGRVRADSVDTRIDLEDPSQIPAIAEPLFSGTGSRLTLTPVMNTDDLMKGLAAAAAG